MTSPADDLLGLADLDPVEPPAGLFDRLLAVALDPATPPADDSFLPRDVSANDHDQIDLTDFDTDHVPTTGSSDLDADSPHESEPDSGGPLADVDSGLGDLDEPDTTPDAGDQDGVGDVEPGVDDLDLGM
ncbi:hypothetical protein G6016_01385 [Dietzia aerolata]|uniref:Uncharacterized protein n=1 Tax=Dietzia aerolata TaxID=595984 RepID=A0ABV5JMF5_9ACTN|nr:hypothetical protein [Dietzia aerolata]MBB0967634.1 hypothetical protein [Dietzia aerolata]